MLPSAFALVVAANLVTSRIVYHFSAEHGQLPRAVVLAGILWIVVALALGCLLYAAPYLHRGWMRPAFEPLARARGPLLQK